MEILKRAPVPAYGKKHRWENYAAEAMIERTQCVEEGKDIKAFEGLFAAICDMPETDAKRRLGDILFELVAQAPQSAGYAYNEPDELMAIRRLRVNSFEATAPDIEALRPKIAGAWYGRIAGCLLGKPVEGVRTEEFYAFLRESGNWPLNRYILSTDVKADAEEKYKFPFAKRASAMADNIQLAPADDDTNYTVLAQALIERVGRDFAPEDMAAHWLRMQPKDAYCTAERVAYVNMVKGYAPPDTAAYQNPYREWIGAQIRGDYFGYINPGDPARAAEMAWRDASISHVKNGIYGEMFIAAMLARAAVDGDMESIIEAGLGEIPRASRLREAVLGVLNGYRAGVSAADAIKGIHLKWDEHTQHGWCHTISNAMIVAAALLYNQNDYAAAICRAVQAGFDTDCNGATVGSIMGMALGLEGIPKRWLEPLNDKLATSLFGMGIVNIPDLIDTTLAHIALPG